MLFWRNGMVIGIGIFKMITDHPGSQQKFQITEISHIIPNQKVVKLCTLKNR